ncbi:hypothetical protein JH06_1754 [Blastocystis sp. subtype 4]|uniref:hypothetical protein n=1 Tax=Blastocystis sp. subtype 4 TaxID=944170 RepID=UPI00071196AB|nr:hypothetical protein JH06_1754 [Blastocystis sp. subtype 4]KNB45132.1 hypothetical protein JH06_1754 [Blastocystis sp. subtype 4]|eukprot:XP_014528570.1 hypothetical protein JH06_1754 [Blastocystis sp. subtype 4]
MSINDLFHIPVVKDDTLRLVCVILNIFIPGLGTIIGGAVDKSNIMVIICGVVQLVCASFFLGFLWSWVWAYFIYCRTQVCK